VHTRYAQAYSNILYMHRIIYSTEAFFLKLTPHKLASSIERSIACSCMVHVTEFTRRAPFRVSQPDASPPRGPHPHDLMTVSSLSSY
jgi:hypothetical protein